MATCSAVRWGPGRQLWGAGHCRSHTALLPRRELHTPRRGLALRAGKDSSTPKYLTFQADPEAGGDEGADDASEVVERAAAALERARAYLAEAKQRAPSRPMPGEASADRREASTAADEPAMRSTLEDALARLSPTDLDWAQDASLQRPPDSRDLQQDKDPGWFDHGSMDEADVATSGAKPSSTPTSKSSKPAGAPQASSSSQAAPPANGSSASAKDGREQSWMQYIPEAKPQAQGLARAKLGFAEPQLAALELTSQSVTDLTGAVVLTRTSKEAELLEASRRSELPPLQSVMELTGAIRMPQRGELPVTSQPTTAGRAMEDGQGVLPDGTQYERQSGEEFGENGHWYRWTRLRGVSQGGKVEWEERWWEASDWGGMREMGAEKSGCGVDGSAWRETWREAIAYDAATGEPLVERSAHKWAHSAKGDEWEERWGEHYRRRGQASKFADKWAREKGQVWHERWGEDYDGEEGCVKWTDKWAERLTLQGGREKWGDKWEERFKHGAGAKTGETWNETAAGDKYQRWWGENHHGNGWVQKHGHSSTGEAWDVSEQMDTYYNPIPHFGYDLALAHSPTLRRVPTRPRGGDDLDNGLDAL